MKKPQIFCLIVIYNKKCEALHASFSLLTKQQCTVVVYDNSEEKSKDSLGNKTFCAANHIIYLDGHGNQGLSVAYNTAARHCRALNSDGILCIFDDDTEITAAYLDCLDKVAGRGEMAIFVPLLKVGDKLISPSLLKPNFHCKLFQSKEQAMAYTGKGLTALNSGMAVDLRIFADYRYDERLFLDGIDHKFMGDMATRGIPVKVMDCVLEHHLSAYEKPSLDSAMHRYKIFKNDVRVFAGSRYKRILLRRTAKLSLQYRTCAFFKEYRSKAMVRTSS